MEIFQGYVAAAVLIVGLFAIYLVSKAIGKTNLTNYPFGRSISQGEQNWAWWAEISTYQPRCTYYFGPFSSRQEAEQEKPGFIEDLQREGAKNITAEVKWCRPQELTRVEEELV